MEKSLTPGERRVHALEQLDAGHRALRESLEGLDPEEAFLGSRWSVWEVLQHLDTSKFVDALEQIASGEMDLLPPFTNRADRLRQDLDLLEANYQRFRSLLADLPEELLNKPVTPPNPINSYPGLTLLELVERTSRHEGTHAQQVEATRKYVAAFTSRKRTVTIVGLGPGDPAFISPRVRELVSFADYTAGSESALAVVRPWVRGAEAVIHSGNTDEVLSRLGREARSGIWSVVCCLGDPAESSPALIASARQHCDHVVIHPGIGIYQLALAAAGRSPQDCLALSMEAVNPSDSGVSSREMTELIDALASNSRHLVVLGPDGPDVWPEIALALVREGVSPERVVTVLSQLRVGGGHLEQTTLARLGQQANPIPTPSALLFPPA